MTLFRAEGETNLDAVSFSVRYHDGGDACLRCKNSSEAHLKSGGRYAFHTPGSRADHDTPRRSGCRRRGTAESDGDADADSRAEDQHRSEGRSRNTPRKAEAGSVPGGQVDGHSSFVLQRRV